MDLRLLKHTREDYDEALEDIRDADVYAAYLLGGRPLFMGTTVSRARFDWVCSDLWVQSLV